MEESFGIINSRTKPLAAYLFTKNKKLEEAFVRSVSAGGMLINDIALHVCFRSLFFYVFFALHIRISEALFFAHLMKTVRRLTVFLLYI